MKTLIALFKLLASDIRGEGFTVDGYCKLALLVLGLAACAVLAECINCV